MRVSFVLGLTNLFLSNVLSRNGTGMGALRRDGHLLRYGLVVGHARAGGQRDGAKK